MKTHFWKKAAALALVLSLFVSLLSVAAAAEEPGTEGEEPASEINLLSDAATTEGSDTDEEQPMEASLPEPQAEQTAAHTHTPGEKHAPDYTVCGGGYQTEYYRCTECHYSVNADGSAATYVPGTGVHTPGSEKYEPCYTECGGGYQTEWYACTVCRCDVEADGSEAEWIPGNGVHTPGSKIYPANYTPCNGGWQTEHYACTACRCPVNADGSEVTYVQGNGVHTPGSEKYEPDYTPCNGGYKTEYYRCTVCNCTLNADGSLAEWIPGNGAHIVGEKMMTDDYRVYTECYGGYKPEIYKCSNGCGIPLNADGSVAEWTEGTGIHTPGSEKYEPDYIPCRGGHKTEWYICTVCDCSVNADGSEAEWTEPTEAHTLGEKLEPFYTPCGGGIQTESYGCTVCGYLVNADGSIATFVPGNGEHQIVSCPATAPTYEEYGWLAHWECSVCRMHFADSEGKDSDSSSLWLPPLTRDTEVTTESLTAVPAAVAGKYATVETIKTALLEIAKAAGFDAGRTNAGSVLLDVALQIKNADGTLTPVSPENFPAEGVSVVLPFPAGTDQNYTFVITHMITHGDRAGEIEVLPSVNSEDGICVSFTSMSPVCISYMLQSGAPAPEPPATTPETPATTPETPAPVPTAPVSTVPKTSDAAHGAPWGMLALLSIGGLGALSIAGKKLYSF